MRKLMEALSKINEDYKVGAIVTFKGKKAKVIDVLGHGAYRLSVNGKQVSATNKDLIEDVYPKQVDEESGHEHGTAWNLVYWMMDAETEHNQRAGEDIAPGKMIEDNTAYEFFVNGERFVIRKE